MSDFVPQLTPRFWIVIDPNGSRSIRAAKFEHFTIDDVRKNLLPGWGVETVLEPELPPEMLELYKSLAAMDDALGARTSPHLRDLFGVLLLRAYEAGVREGTMSARFGIRKPSLAL